MNLVHRKFHFAVALLAANLIASASDAAERVSFRNDVQAVLSKAGCNMGTCHGNANGKGGFKLSLRGEDNSYDFNILSREAFARRVNPFDPDQSLVLLKATMQVAHEGGLRFAKDSAEYATLRRWIAEGLPADAPGTPVVTRIEVSPVEKILVEPSREMQIAAEAFFSDGSRRDVTTLAVYEPSNPSVTVSHDGLVRWDKTGEVTVNVRFLGQQVPVRLAFVPARPGFVWKNPPRNNSIDGFVFAKLRQLRINPSDLASDTVFLRRAHLDLLGLLPTADEAKTFLSDKRKDKRARLVDELLERPEFADFWAIKWSDLLRAEEKSLDRKGVQNFHHWILQSLAENKPLDQFVREVVTGRGSTYASPAGNYLRALRDPVSRAESTAQVFLGTRLLCAQCHNHPFDRWTQDDYFNWTSLFARVQYRVMENNKRDKLDSHEFVGEQMVVMARDGEVKNARTGKDAAPRFLGADAVGEDADRLEALAAWITSPDNPRFAKAQVNRVWFHLMGRGIVDPIDDFRPTNPPSHPALLEALAKDFTTHKFDLRYLIRLIMNSRAYQLASEPNDTNRDDEVNYSHVAPRRLSAEQMLDAQHQALGVAPQFAGYPVGLRATQIPGVAATPRREMRATMDDKFLTVFGKPMRLLTCECERSGETTMNQAFQFITGPAINQLLGAPGNRLGKMLAANKSPGEIMDELYWAALNRPPTDKELRENVAYLEKAKDRRAALEDITWGLLNAKEFVLRR
ncbi:MAG: DUF1549 domain-containing protein [Verrucomicrobia bacterium]|nr:DUF1549 domain-containing protein [Verrucomicrobiota bacterium]